MTRRAPIAGAVVLVALVAAGPAADAKKTSRKNLWSTVNICDTQKHPNQLGIRGRMPGDGRDEKMWMRFIVQYMHSGKWVRVKTGGVSPWRKAGSALFTYSETGWTFRFDSLAPGEGYTMRGLVKFEWRKHGNVLRRRHAYTSAHHPTGFGDPKRYSKATCFVSG
jgi:hypothetical protein